MFGSHVENPELDKFELEVCGRECRAFLVLLQNYTKKSVKSQRVKKNVREGHYSSSEIIFGEHSMHDTLSLLSFSLKCKFTASFATEPTSYVVVVLECSEIRPIYCDNN